VVDQLRGFVNRPLEDGDRRRLFAVAVALIAAAAGVMAVLDDAGPAADRTGTRHVIDSGPSAASALAVPASTPVAPSEESQPQTGPQGSSLDVARSKRAARRFLAGYLSYAYGRGPVRSIDSATAQLRADLARRPPRVPAAERRRRARVELLQSNGVSRQRAALLAVIRDGQRRYSIGLQLANTPAGWLVTGLGR
jgi:hypothetical protein